MVDEQHDTSVDTTINNEETAPPVSSEVLSANVRQPILQYMPGLLAAFAPEAAAASRFRQSQRQIFEKPRNDYRCIECGTDIPPGKPNRRCKACRGIT